MNIDDMLKLLVDKYGQCMSYSDRGRAIVHDCLTTFETKMIRDRMFNFRWIGAFGMEDELDSRDGHVRLSGVDYPDLPSAVIAATGMSGGAAHLISTLLIPNLLPKSSMPLSNVGWEVADDLSMANSAIAHASINYQPECKTEVWFDFEELRLYRIRDSFVITDTQRQRAINAASICLPNIADVLIKLISEEQESTSPIIMDTFFDAVKFGVEMPK